MRDDMYVGDVLCLLTNEENMESDVSIQYMYCATEKSMQNLQNRLDKIISASDKPFILLDTKSRELSSLNGRLSLIQLSLGTTAHLVDTLSYPAAIPTLKRYLESPHLANTSGIEGQIIQNFNMDVESL
jgi:ribonuclease D